MNKDLVRFLSKVDQYELVDMCWIWKSVRKWGVYGSFYVDGKYWLAHRWIYIYFFGEIAEELVVDHLCKIKLCVNPMHLEAVDRSTNTIRAMSYKREWTHCKYGHEYTLENTHIQKMPNGAVKRACKACKHIYYIMKTRGYLLRGYTNEWR